MSETWAWDKDKNIWITSFYIPGKESYDADTESRKKNKLNWNGCLTKTFLQKLFPSFSLNQVGLICIKAHCLTTSLIPS